MVFSFWFLSFCKMYEICIHVSSHYLHLAFLVDGHGLLVALGSQLLGKRGGYDPIVDVRRGVEMTFPILLWSEVTKELNFILAASK